MLVESMTRDSLQKHQQRGQRHPTFCDLMQPIRDPFPHEHAPQMDRRGPLARRLAEG